MLKVMFVYNFDSGINFCGNSFLQMVQKTTKIAKFRTRKNLVPHGNPPIPLTATDKKPLMISEITYSSTGT